MISVQIWYRLLLWGGGGWTLFLDTGCMWSDWAVGLEIRVAPAQLRRPGRSHFTSIKSIHLLNEKSVSLQCSITSIKPMDLKTVFLLWYLELSWVLPWIAQCCPSRRVSPLWATSWRPSDVTGADGMEFASAYLLIWHEMFFFEQSIPSLSSCGLQVWKFNRLQNHVLQLQFQSRPKKQLEKHHKIFCTQFKLQSNFFDTWLVASVRRRPVVLQSLYLTYCITFSFFGII